MVMRVWDDLLAALLIVGCITLIGLGRDGEVKAILGTAAGYLFGKRAGGKFLR